MRRLLWAKGTSAGLCGERTGDFHKGQVFGGLEQDLPKGITPSILHVGQGFAFNYTYCKVSPDHWCFHRPLMMCRIPAENNKELWDKQIQAKFPFPQWRSIQACTGHLSSLSLDFDM